MTMTASQMLMSPATTEETARVGAAVDFARVQAAEWFVARMASNDVDRESPGHFMAGTPIRSKPHRWQVQDVGGLSRTPDGLGFVEADPASADPRSVFIASVSITEDQLLHRSKPLSIEGASIRAVVTGGEHDRELLRGSTRDAWVRAAIRSERAENAREGGRPLTAVDRGRFMMADVGMQLEAAARLDHPESDRSGDAAAFPSKGLVAMGFPDHVDASISQAVAGMDRSDLKALRDGGVMSQSGAESAVGVLGKVHDMDTKEIDGRATQAILPDRWIHTRMPVDYLTLRDMSKADERSSLVRRDQVMRREDEWGLAGGRAAVTGKPLVEVEREHRRMGGARVVSVIGDLVRGRGLSVRSKGPDSMDKPMGGKGPSTVDHVSAYRDLVGPRGR